MEILYLMLLSLWLLLFGNWVYVSLHNKHNLMFNVLTNFQFENHIQREREETFIERQEAALLQGVGGEVRDKSSCISRF